MQLEGSCHCGAVRFKVVSETPYPHMRCYCSICRKTGGGGGYAINIMGNADTLQIEGEAHLKIYRARLTKDDGSHTISEMRRHFCGTCGSALWGSDPRWAQWVYPFASAIDTPLPAPPERNHIMLEFKAPWVDVPDGYAEHHFERYPDEAIIDWHKRLELLR